jgi:hypothetical protein
MFKISFRSFLVIFPVVLFNIKNYANAKTLLLDFQSLKIKFSECMNLLLKQKAKIIKSCFHRKNESSGLLENYTEIFIFTFILCNYREFKKPDKQFSPFPFNCDTYFCTYSSFYCICFALNADIINKCYVNQV